MRVLAILFLFMLPNSAFAYIGPGLGAGAVGVALGFIVSICLALLAILYYPIKRLIKKIKAKSKAKTTNTDSE